MNRPVGEIPRRGSRRAEQVPIAAPEADRARVLLVDDDERNLLAVATRPRGSRRSRPRAAPARRRFATC